MFLLNLLMPKTARTVILNYPHHLIQRGHNRQVVFADDSDYMYYLENLRDWKEKLRCKVYAFCLMTNHVHLIVEPTDKAENMSLLIKRVAGRQTRYVNKLEGRYGTLWEGRYKSSSVDRDEYLMACYRYVELNPVRAGLVPVPQDYRYFISARKVSQARQ
ncbi:MAG: transposase [Nitrospirae bacterium]|nr:transposase [Nitrospirota bacterium]